MRATGRGAGGARNVIVGKSGARGGRWVLCGGGTCVLVRAVRVWLVWFMLAFKFVIRQRKRCLEQHAGACSSQLDQTLIRPIKTKCIRIPFPHGLLPPATSRLPS